MTTAIECCDHPTGDCHDQPFNPRAQIKFCLEVINSHTYPTCRCSHISPSKYATFTHRSFRVHCKTQPQSVIVFDTRERNNNVISGVEASLPVKLSSNNHQMITLVGYNTNAAHQKSPRHNHDHPHPHSSHHKHTPGRSAIPSCQIQCRKISDSKPPDPIQEDQQFQAARSNPGRLES